MATKVKLMKFLQEMRGFSEMVRKHPTPKPSALYLMQLRTHLSDASHSKRRLIISVDLKDDAAIPHPVRITHVNSNQRIQVPPMTPE